MTKTRLLQAVCTVAMLAAAPAFAQSNTPTGDTGVGGKPNHPTTAGTPDTSGGMTPAHGSMGGPASHAAMEGHSTHRSGMMHTAGTSHARNDATAQDAAVDRLNEKSYQAARTGQSYGGGTPGTMNDMSGGSMSPAGATGNK